MRLLDHLHCAPNNPFGHGTGGPRSGKIADHIGGYSRAGVDQAQLPIVIKRVPCARPYRRIGAGRRRAGSLLPSAHSACFGVVSRH